MTWEWARQTPNRRRGDGAFVAGVIVSGVIVNILTI